MKLCMRNILYGQTKAYPSASLESAHSSECHISAFDNLIIVGYANTHAIGTAIQWMSSEHIRFVYLCFMPCARSAQAVENKIKESKGSNEKKNYFEFWRWQFRVCIAPAHLQPYTHQRGVKMNGWQRSRARLGSNRAAAKRTGKKTFHL